MRHLPDPALLGAGAEQHAHHGGLQVLPDRRFAAIHERGHTHCGRFEGREPVDLVDAIGDRALVARRDGPVVDQKLLGTRCCTNAADGRPSAASTVAAVGSACGPTPVTLALPSPARPAR